jgi:hypothetical protein
MTSPNNLKRYFKEVFEEQNAIENDPAFQARKQKYQHIK